MGSRCGSGLHRAPIKGQDRPAALEEAVVTAEITDEAEMGRQAAVGDRAVQAFVGFVDAG